MFKRVIFWSEFPEQVNWEKVKNLIDFKTEIYVACKTRKEFKKWEKKVKNKNIKIGAWPVLEKKDGYWFSGFTSKKNIDKLKEFKGLKIKVDLEPPIPPFNYSNLKIIYWLIKMYFKKAKNKDYLRSTMYYLVRNNTNILVNEFPLPKFYLEKLGITIKKEKNMTLQLMMYTSPLGKLFRPLIRWYNKKILKKTLKKNNNMIASIGLIGPGILKTEGYYKNIKEFVEDLKMVQSTGLKSITIYSIDTLMQRKNPKEWINALKEFI